MPAQRPLMRPLVVLALPGMYLLYKYNQYRQQQMETARRRVTERELMHLNTKIWKRAVKDMPMPPAPFRWLDCAWRAKVKGEEQPPPPEPEPEPEPIALPEPKPVICDIPKSRPAVQVSILGADTNLGHYISLLLKQCPQIKKLRLYPSCNKDAASGCSRNMYNVVTDLQHIDTNCEVEAYCSHDFGLNCCLQSTDIVLMLDNGCLPADLPVHQRFHSQAPMVKRYADAIAHTCPTAFVIVCASPIDCMVPLIAETLKETGWYDPRKVLGSVAVPEMRASTLCARALCLEPKLTRVPCVGGTEGEALVPLFSQAVDFFEFSEQSAQMMTDTVRNAPAVVTRCEGPCTRASDLSEAFAVSRLVTNVANGLLCLDVPRVSGFVETDGSHIISPARYLTSEVLLNTTGVSKQFSFPAGLHDNELGLIYHAFSHLKNMVEIAEKWHSKIADIASIQQQRNSQVEFFDPTHCEHLDACHHHSVQ